MNFNYCYKITYESGETYDRRRNELSVEISKEDYKKIITGVLQERPIDQIEGISDVIDKMTENVEFADRFMNKNGSLRKTPLKKNFNRKKQSGIRKIIVNGKTIVEAVV